MKIKTKNFLFFILANFLFFFILEALFTFFFVYHKSNYHGPLTRIFSTAVIKKPKLARQTRGSFVKDVVAVFLFAVLAIPYG